jgi:hypothetical protein
MDSIYQIIDQKLAQIENQNKRASIIIINDKLFQQMQQEMLFRDMSQAYGRVRSPYDLQVYNKIKVMPSQVCDSVEVF